MDILKSKPEKPPTPERLARIESDEEIRTTEVLQDFDPTTVNRLRELSDKILEGGRSDVFFQPYVYIQTQNGDGSIMTQTKDNPFYSKAYLPFYLLFDRGHTLGNMDENDMRKWRSKVEKTAEICMRLADNLNAPQEVYAMIEVMEDHLKQIVPNQAKGGFKMKTMFVQEKMVRLMTQNPEKKKSWWNL